MALFILAIHATECHWRSIFLCQDNSPTVSQSAILAEIARILLQSHLYSQYVTTIASR